LWEHPECSGVSNGYLGEDGIVERDRFGSPRCHLCGWYQRHLDLHVFEEHKMTAEEYRIFFSIPDNESLVAYEVEVESISSVSLFSDKSSNQELVFGRSEKFPKLLPRSSLSRKIGNPLNKKRKTRGRKSRW